MELTSALAKLLTDADLLDAFAASPQEVGRRLGLSGEDLECFVRLDETELRRQSQTLIDKRWHEVAELLPEAIGQLGDQGAELFRFFARRRWPEGHRRHALDALGFLDFLRRNQILNPPGKEYARVRRLARRG